MHTSENHGDPGQPIGKSMTPSLGASPAPLARSFLDLNVGCMTKECLNDLGCLSSTERQHGI